MDIKAMGGRITALRREKNMTQSQLGERIGVSAQAVSKWERGETLPDTALLPALSRALGTSTDFILCGGRQSLDFRGRVSVSQMAEGLNCLKLMGEKLGRDNILYRHAVEGINEKMNTDIEQAFVDENVFECFLAEAIINALMSGRYVDPCDVSASFKNPRFRDIVLNYCTQYGIE